VFVCDDCHRAVDPTDVTIDEDVEALRRDVPHLIGVGPDEVDGDLWRIAIERSAEVQAMVADVQGVTDERDRGSSS
jgi:hypothetical protein